jgi:hypothetical protein
MRDIFRRRSFSASSPGIILGVSRKRLRQEHHLNSHVYYEQPEELTSCHYPHLARKRKHHEQRISNSLQHSLGYRPM